MHLTIHGVPGTAVAAVYDRLMHPRACTYTPMLKKNRHTALRSAQDGA